MLNVAFCLYVCEHNDTIIRIIMNTPQYLSQTIYQKLIKKIQYVDLIEDENVISFQATYGKYVLEFYTHVDKYEFAIESCYKQEGEDYTRFKPTETQTSEMNKILSEKYAEYRQNINEMRQAELVACWEELEENKYERWI